MAKTLTALDAHATINELYRLATGEEPEISAVDTSTFVSVGERILSTGVDNVLHALSVLIGKTIIDVSPYNAKFGLIEEEDSEIFLSRIRAISFYSRYAMPSGDWNTQLYTNLANGFTNGQNLDANGDPQSTPSMWYQNQPKALELNFGGFDTWQDSTVVYENQIAPAFTDERSFNEFMAGILTEKGNDIESEKEAFRRMTLINHIGGVYALSEDFPSMAVNVTEAYNTEFGTNYTSQELRTTYRKDFLSYFVELLKTISRRMEYRTTLFHNPYTITDENEDEWNVLRHTNKDEQRLFIFNPLILRAESMVLPEIFNDQYLKIENYEPVDFWQSIADPAKVSVKPAIPGSNGTQTTTDEAVTIPYVCAVLFDKDAVFTNNYYDTALASPIEARKRYSTLWFHFCKGAFNNYSKPFVLFYMDDTEPAPTGMTVTPDPIALVGNTPVTVTVSNLPEGTTVVGAIDIENKLTITEATISEGVATFTVTNSELSDGDTDILNIGCIGASGYLATVSVIVSYTAGE